MLEHEPRVGGSPGPHEGDGVDARLVVGQLPQPGDLTLELVLAAGRDHLAPDVLGPIGGGPLLGQPRRHLGALGVAHQRHHVAVGGAGDQGLEPAELCPVGLDVGHSSPGQTGAQVRLELLHRASAKVVLLVCRDDPVGP